jgi:hypothetical protein
MRDPKAIEAELLDILASATEQEFLSRMRVYIKSLPEDELEYGQRFMAQRVAWVRKAFSRNPSPR